MIALALGTLLLAAPQAKTVEQRIRELESRLGALEKRAAAAKAENDTLEKKFVAAEEAKEKIILARAAGWVKNIARPSGFSDERCGELEALWIDWERDDFGKRVPVETWRRREAELKGRLTPREAAQLAGTVRAGQERYAREAIAKFWSTAKLGALAVVALQEAALDRMKFPDTALLPAAHPGTRVDWPAVHRAVEASLPGLGDRLTEEERTNLRALLEKWKPPTVRIQVGTLEKK